MPDHIIAGRVADGGLPIRIDRVSKQYGGFRALDDVSIDIPGGMLVSLLGASGSGKTTLMMAVAGFVRIDAGRIFHGTGDITLLPPHKRDFGVVFQSYALFPHLNVAENIAYPLRMRGIARAEREERVLRALDLVRLGGRGDAPVTRLSGGQRQRVALARAIVFEPRVLLMDESLSALDKHLREQMQIEIRQIHERLGITTIFVTHDQHEAITLSDRIAIMDKGRVIQMDAPQSLYEAPGSLTVARFMGESTLIPVRVSERGAWLGDTLLRVAAEMDRTLPDQFLFLRPEHLRLLAEGQDPGGLNVIPGRAERAIYQGNSTLMSVRGPGRAPIALRLSGAEAEAALALAPGTPVRLGVEPRHCRIFADDGRQAEGGDD